jgi:hypothetical protein
MTRAVIKKAKNLVEIVTGYINRGEGGHPSYRGVYVFILEDMVEPGVMAVVTTKLLTFSIICALLPFSGSYAFLARQINLTNSFDDILFEIVPPDTPRITKEMLRGDPVG